MPRLRHLMLAPIILTTAANCWAQSLQEVYEAARAYDATYLAARAQADSAQYRTAQSRALRLPTVNLTGSATRSESDVPLSAGAANTRLGDTTTSAAVSARQPLFNSGNKATIAQAERSLEAAQADLQAAEQELIVRTAQTYFDVVVAQDALAAAQASTKAISEQLASAKRNFEVGTATITDTREAQARFDLARASEIAAENDLRTKQIALDQLIGRSNVAPRPLTKPETMPALVPAVVDDWVGQA